VQELTRLKLWFKRYEGLKIRILNWKSNKLKQGPNCKFWKLITAQVKNCGAGSEFFLKLRTEIEMLESSGGSLQISHDLQNNKLIFVLQTCEPSPWAMHHGDSPVHHGPAIMAGLGPTGAVPFGRSSRRELDVRLWKERGGLGGPYRGLRWSAKRQVLAGDDEQRRRPVVLGGKGMSDGMEVGCMGCKLLLGQRPVGPQMLSWPGHAGKLTEKNENKIFNRMGCTRILGHWEK
jgi:hypothetical protein